MSNHFSGYVNEKMFFYFILAYNQSKRLRSSLIQQQILNMLFVLFFISNIFLQIFTLDLHIMLKLIYSFNRMVCLKLCGFVHFLLELIHVLKFVAIF